MGRGYVAHAAVTAEAGPDGRTRLTRLRSDGPIALRETPDGVYLVGAAAGPLGGDRLRLDIEVGAGASLTIRSVATALAMPGDGESVYTIDARVDGHLDFAPEPTVAVRGCRHRAVTRIDLGPSATLRWLEELVLGRHNEPPGLHTSRIDITRSGHPLLRHELRADPTSRSRAILADAKAIGSLIRTETSTPHTQPGLAILPLSSGGTLANAHAPNTPTLRHLLQTAETLIP
ncbi:urease accessory protein UreD [Actinocorallia sp. A-T 12471]|uniref:urease accessory protein UreD n=1 Tax=Actinocorallia sp. A-T 12471 TaxID=3089813 RepID=UPI0029CC6A51|nr:urease accessory protein UreD [Actinocorallia sp. A-T 12471]MDX6744691.1 urease accessory protein UreD [Actinocorallia sp. A-T 12471]